MRKEYFFLAIAGLLFLYFPVPAQVFPGLPFIKTYGTSDYGAGIQNWDIAQDERGLLYFANNFGLLEYDGRYWQTYTVQKGAKVRCLSMGPDGRIFIGSQREFGYFSPAANGSWQYISLADSLPAEERNFDETWRIFQLNGKVYFCTFQDIFVYDGQMLQVIHPDNPLEFSFLANNRLYVLDWEEGLHTIQQDRLEPVPDGEQFRHKRIVAILPYSQQKLLIVTQKHGLYLYDGHQFSETSPLPDSSVSNALLNCAIRMENGNYVLGSQSNGLFLLNHRLELLQQLDKKEGLNDHTVVSLYEDRHNNLWAGHNNGLSYIELSSPFTLLDEKIQVPGSGYAAFLQQDTLYLGTNNGLYVGIRQGGKNLSFSLVKNSQGQVYHLSRQGNEILMGHHNGAFRIKNMAAQPLSQRTGIWQFLRLQNHPEVLLEGSYSGFSIYKEGPEGWQWSKHLDGFEESSRIFEEDAEGNIWMTHGYKGVYKIHLNKTLDRLEEVRFYGQEDGLPSNMLNNVSKIKNQLVFTAETGAYRYHKASDRFLPDSGLTQVLGPNQRIHKLRQDANGRIYFVGQHKLGSVAQDKFGHWEADTSRFYKVLKLLNDDLDYLAILDNQNVLFGAKEGFIHFNPSQPPARPVPVEVHIRKVESSLQTDSLLFGGNFFKDGRLSAKQTSDARLRLPYNQNAVRFYFSAPFFDGSEHLTYQFYLDNFDQEWSSWSKQAFKEYTNLHEGNYTFKVRAKTIYGDISPEATYRFSIAPPWYRAPLAYLGYSLFAAGLLFAGMYTVDQKHRKDKRLLTAKQLKALNQKKIELNSLSKRTEEEITRLKNEKLESEILHKNKELATSTMHIVTKNEFIGEIKTNLNSIVKESAAKGISKELNKIIKEIDQNIATDKDWEQFQLHFDQVHGDFSKRLKSAYAGLTPQEMKLCAYLRLNLSTKEIAQLMHISVRGVEISRYRLRKKLELDRQDNLLDFILNF